MQCYMHYTVNVTKIKYCTIYVYIGVLCLLLTMTPIYQTRLCYTRGLFGLEEGARNIEKCIYCSSLYRVFAVVHPRQTLQMSLHYTVSWSGVTVMVNQSPGHIVIYEGFGRSFKANLEMSVCLRRIGVDASYSLMFIQD